jgi:DNA-binding NarL/FixJ family response regulator
MLSEATGNRVKVLVLVLGSQEITREGLQLLLKDCPECGPLYGANSLKRAEELAGEIYPELILVAFGAPLCLVNAVRRLKGIVPGACVIVLSSELRDPEVADVLDWELRNVGTNALLSSTVSSVHLRQAIRECLAGEKVSLNFGAEMPVPTARALPIAQLQFRNGPRDDGLTLRQAQVLRLIAEGLLSKEIADQLGISIKTVEKHRQSVKERLHASNTADLTRRAIELGLA